MTEEQMNKVQQIVRTLQKHIKTASEEIEEDLVTMDRSTTKNPEIFLGFMEHRARTLEYHAEEANLGIKAIIESLKEPANV
jgi:hypothetical protein